MTIIKDKFDISNEEDRKELSLSTITDDFDVVDSEEGYASRLTLEDGKLHKTTYVDWDEIKELVASAAHHRQQETAFTSNKGGALAVKAFSLPSVVGEWILDTYNIHDYQTNPDSHKRFLKSIEQDSIPGVGAIRLFKFTNKRLI